MVIGGISTPSMDEATPYMAWGAGGAGVASALMLGLRMRGISVSPLASFGIVAGAAGIGALIKAALECASRNGADSDPGITPQPMGPTSVRIAQLNAHNLFDTVDDPSKQDDVPTGKEHQLHLDKLAHAIADDLGAPDVVATQEVENLAVLEEVANHPLLKQYGYRAVLLEGSDPRSIDVGVLYRDESFALKAASQQNTMIPSGASGRLTKLFTRPPLVVELERRTPEGAVEGAVDGESDLTLIVNHWTSKLGGESSEPRRLAQGQFLNQVAATRLGQDPYERLLLIGDLNSDEIDPPYLALMDAESGAELTDLTSSIGADDRYTYIYRGDRYKLDHTIGSPGLGDALAGAEIVHMNTAANAADKRNPDIGAGVSDHDPIVVEVADA